MHVLVDANWNLHTVESGRKNIWCEFLFSFYDYVRFSSTTLNNILTLSRRRPLWYRNQYIGLLRKSMDWFLYDNGLRLERVKFFKSSDFCFLTFTFVNICHNLSFEPLLSNFPRATLGPSFEWLLSFPEKEWTIFKSLFCTLPCSKVNVWNHRFLYVSRWNTSTVLLNL